MALLEIAELTKAYGKSPGPLRGLSLGVEEGETLVLLGASGGGKTTLLRLIAGLESPTQGTVRLDGIEVSSLLPMDRDIGCLFQNVTLAPHLTCLQNILLPTRGKPDTETHDRLRALARDLELEGVLERSPAEVSAGQRQRVALSRALLLPRKLLLLDEPMTHLDVPLRKHVRQVIKRHGQARAMIVVSHDPADAWELADIIAVLHDGQIIFHGTKQQAREPNVSTEARRLLDLD